MGYVGPIVTSQLKKSYPDADLVGADAGYFAGCLADTPFLPETLLDRQYFLDIRDSIEDILNGVDVVIHLAAISNDPMGEAYKVVTDEINLEASKRLVVMAKKSGVKKFIFASSCSVYGKLDKDRPLNELDPVNPLTAYARSKVGLEDFLSSTVDNSFKAIALRFATACGMSPRVRLDLVLNDFVTSALLNKEIEVLSDGSPWRPLIHVKDMARAIDWAVSFEDFQALDANLLTVNAGSNNWNYRISELANQVSKTLGNVKVKINDSAMPDDRSYRVDFSKFEKLAPNYQPLMSLESAIIDLSDGMSKIIKSTSCFDKHVYYRLKTLNELVRKGLLNKNLFWEFGKL